MKTITPILINIKTTKTFFASLLFLLTFSTTLLAINTSHFSSVKSGSNKITKDDKKYIARDKATFNGSKKIWVFDKESYKSFEYLNKFRKKPVKFGSQIGLRLNGLRPSNHLSWDPILAKAATAKAMDMALNDYFSHTDRKGSGMNFRVYKAGYRLPATWIENRQSNFIESIAANSESPDKFIEQLIIDKDVPGKGHRTHLLAMNEFYRKARHCGIGIIYDPNSKYKYYCSVLIAP